MNDLEQLKRNKLVARMCYNYIKSNERIVANVAMRVATLLKKWWSTLPPGSKINYVDDDRFDLIALAVMCYCKLVPYVRPSEPIRFKTHFQESPWNQRPVKARHGAMEYEAKLHACWENYKDHRQEIIHWSHAIRWYDYLANGFDQVESHIAFDDPLIGQLRESLIKSYDSASHGNSFFARGRDWICATALPLGARDDFCRTRPFEGSDTAIAKLFANYVSKEKQEQIYKQNKVDLSRSSELVKLDSEYFDLWLLNHYGFGFDQESIAQSHFHENYLILWHQWDASNTEKLLKWTHTAHKPTLPLICSLGANHWGVLRRSVLPEGQNPVFLVCKNIPHAILTWLTIVYLDHRGESEIGSKVWKCDLPLREI